MGTILRVLAGAMLAVVLGVYLNKQNKDIGIVLMLIVSAMILGVVADQLRPLMVFLSRLRQLAGMDAEGVEILFKAVGIGMLTQIASLICNDSGNGALGRSVQILGTVTILVLGIPMMEKLLELIQEMLGKV